MLIHTWRGRKPQNALLLHDDGPSRPPRRDHLNLHASGRRRLVENRRGTQDSVGDVPEEDVQVNVADAMVVNADIEGSPHSH